MTDGVVRGLIGPREAPRIWERHLLNCAAVAELVPVGQRVVDVGSGAGLPGVVLAITRPDLSVTLVEPLARRAAFLAEAVAALGLARTTVVRARAEECAEQGLIEPAEVVAARAVAALDRLAAWCLPLTVNGGRVLALKGESAEQEVATHEAAIRSLGGAAPVIRRCGVGVVEPPVTVVEITRERPVSPRLTGRSRPPTRRREGRQR
jgi:16S rRNA (guanine527-N7)-methyltransferase